MVDGVYENRTFTCEEDVWEVIRLIIGETKEMSDKDNRDFSTSASIKIQLPFFACNNIIYDRNIQRDIQKYLYCENFKTKPYPGSYGSQPARWVQKSFIIKKAINDIQEKAIENGK